MGMTELKRPEKSNRRYFTVSQPLSLCTHPASCPWTRFLGARWWQEEPGVGSSAAYPQPQLHMMVLLAPPQGGLTAFVCTVPQWCFFINSRNNFLNQ